MRFLEGLNNIESLFCMDVMVNFKDIWGKNAVGFIFIIILFLFILIFVIILGILIFLRRIFISFFILSVINFI